MWETCTLKKNLVWNGRKNPHTIAINNIKYNVNYMALLYIYVYDEGTTHLTDNQMQLKKN